MREEEKRREKKREEERRREKKREEGRRREKKGEEERRREKKREEEKESEERRSSCAKRKENCETLCFLTICGPGGSKSRLAEAAGSELSGEMRNEKLHAVVARSAVASEKFRARHVRSTFGN